MADLNEWLEAAKAKEIDRKLDMIHALQLSQPVDSKHLSQRQGQLTRLEVQREFHLLYNRYTESHSVAEATKRGDEFLRRAREEWEAQKARTLN